jgi:hypothetical protein
LRVLPPTSELEITTRALPPVVNSKTLAYQGSMGAAGGVKPYSWKVAGGTLPNGIVLSSEGVFSGAPKDGVLVGETLVTFEVQDSVGTRARASMKVKVVVTGALLVKNLLVPDSLVNYEYLTDLAAVNADASALALPLTWSIAAGTLPDGLALSTASGDRGIIQGKPLVAGTYAFSVQVVDAKGRSDVADFILRVFPVRFRVTATGVPTGLHPGDAVDFALSSVGGAAATTRFALYSGSLPPGVSLDPSGKVSGTIATENAVGVYNFVAQAKDGFGGSGLGAFSLEVTLAPRAQSCSSAPSASGWLGLLVAFASLALAARRRRAQPTAAWVAATLVVGTLVATPARAQFVTSSVQPYAPLVGGTAVAFQGSYGPNVDEGYAAIPLGFTFPFSGTNVTTIGVNTNGLILITAAANTACNPVGGSGCLSPRAVPSTTGTFHGFVAPWWDDLQGGTGREVRYVKTATDITIEFSNWGYYSGPTGSINFKVKLAASGIVQVHYGTHSGSGATTAGLEDATGARGAALLTCGPTCSNANWPTNTLYNIDFVLPPDLSVGSVSGDPTAYAGVNFNSSAVIRNTGGSAATGASVRFYLGSGPGFDAGYPVLGNSAPVAVPTGGQQLVTATGLIPAGTAPGTYFLISKVDPDNLILETSEDNNVGLPVPFKVAPPAPDLVVASVSGPAQATSGQTLSITRAIQNAGSAPVTAAFKYTYFISDNSAVSYSDVAIAPAGTVASLAEGAVDTQTDSVVLPGTLAAGKYWVGVCVDYDPAATPVSTVTEISEVNNCTAALSGFILNTGALAIVTTTLPGAAQYSPFGLRLQATGGDGQYSWTMPSGQLPAGMAMNPAGDLTGTPSEAGSFPFDVKVVSGGGEATVSLTLVVAPSNLPLTISPMDLPCAEFSRTYSAFLVATGGKPPYTWTLKAGSSLPAGLALATDGQIEGRPAAAGETPFTVELVDTAGGKASKDLRLRVVTPSSMHIANTSLETGYLNKDYLQPLLAVGGKPPYTWSVVKFQQLAENPTDSPGKALTAIPDWLGIKIDVDPSGQYLLRGAPIMAGLYALTLRVQDSSAGPGPFEDITTMPLTVTYDEALAITTLALPDAFVGHAYLANLSHNGGNQAKGILFTVPCVRQVAANLEDYGCASADPMQTTPPGMMLDPTGQISGSPTALPAGTSATTTPVVYSFLVKVADAQGRQDVRSLSIKVRPDFGTDQTGSSCAGVPLSPSLGALLASALWALRARRRK